MDAALYHPEHGYYRGGRDPFGRAGDFYTAAQIQPVFGRLMAGLMRSLRRALGDPEEFTVVELGAGRGEMAEAFAGFRYVAIERDRGEMPEGFAGAVFANEFFDALPVHVLKWAGGRFREMLVGVSGGRFVWVEGDEAPAAAEDCIRDCGPRLEEGMIVEANLDALDWIDTIARRMARGFLVAIDYGYTAEELARFPQGTLMSYRSHRACPGVLEDPGGRDITSHVNFTAIERRLRRRGFAAVRTERLASTILRAGEPDRFAAALQADRAEEAFTLRLQLKRLLFDLGETFWTLTAEKAASEGQ